MSAAPPPPEERRAADWRAFGIALAACLALAPCALAAFVWDDELYIALSPTIRDPHGLARIWFEPLVSPNPYPILFSAYWLQYRLWGDGPVGYHVVNVLLHAANSVLLWKLLTRLRAPGALFAALLFAVHPIHVDSIAQVAELKDVLSGLFYLVAALAWLDFTARERPAPYAAALGLFAASMLVKTVTCTLPAALLILAWRDEPESLRRRLRQLAPMFALALGLSAVVVLWERFRTGARGEKFDLSLLQRLLIAGRAPWFYAGKLVWPSNLMMLYPKWPLDARSLEPVFPLASAVALAGLWRARGRVGKGTLACAAFYLATLFPALGFLDYSTMFYSYVADHYQYLAGIGLIALGAALAERAMKGLPRELALAAKGAALIALGAVTWGECLTFRSVESLWRHNALKDPNAASPHYDIGLELKKAGRPAEARAETFKALALDADYAEAWLLLAKLDEEAGAPEKAIRALEWAARARLRNEKALRTRALALSNLSILLAGRGRLEDSFARASEAVRVDPSLGDARNALGAAHERAGRIAEAAEQYRRALDLRPRFFDAALNLGRALSALGRPKEARAALETALTVRPDNPAALAALGGTLFQLNDPAGAAERFAAALRGMPDSPDLRLNLGSALATLGRLDEAIEQFEAALKLRPGDPQALGNLERARGQRDRGRERVGASSLPKS